MFGTELFFDPLVATFLIGISSVFLLYWYSTRNHDYWEKRSIPFVKPLPFIGTIWETLRNPVHEVEIRRYKRYGSLYGHFEGTKAVLSVADPALLRDILVKDFPIFTNRRNIEIGDEVLSKMLMFVRGEDWKRIRSIITPTFTTGKIKRMMSIFKDCAEILEKNFRTETENGKPVDIKRIYGAFTMDVIASSAFSTKIDSHNDPDNEFIKKTKWAMSRSAILPLLLLFIFPSIFKRLNLGRGQLEFLFQIIHQITEERKRTGKSRNDFLQLLIDAAKDVEDEQKRDSPENEKADIASNYGQEDTNKQIFKNVTSKHLSMNELVAQCIIFFLAGYGTTESTLTFATYSLALNPEVQEKLRAEVDESLQNTGGELTYDAVQSMKYLDNVISETLRMFPPGVKLERAAEADYKLGDTGVTIPKGMIITIPLIALHMDPEHFHEPETFDPDRFTAEERAKRHQYAYLPFGAGPRNCVAMRFALMEIKVCLAHVISNFIIKRSPQTKVPLEFKNNASTMEPKEILVDLEIRKDRPLVKQLQNSS